MDKRNGRELSPDEQYKRREQAIRLREKGMSNGEISEIVGISRTHVSTIWQRYKNYGLNGLQSKVQGRKPKLSVGQETKIHEFLLNKTPAELKLGLNLWTRKAVRLAIEQEMEVALPSRTIGDYLMRWGCVAGMPANRADRQGMDAIKRWWELDYPTIEARAKKENAEIHWCDYSESCLESDDTAGFHVVHKISTITNQGKTRFMLFGGEITTEIFYKFLLRLLGDVKRKIFLILYDHPTHHRKAVESFLRGKENQIEFFYLPSEFPKYDHDENVDEHRTLGVPLPLLRQNRMKHKTYYGIPFPIIQKGRKKPG